MNEQKDWEKFYQSFNKLNITPEHIKIANLIKEANPNSKDIIDIGCGGGEHSICFSNVGFKTYSLDISSLLIDTLSKNIKEKGLDIVLIAEDYKNYDIKHDISFLSFSPAIQEKEDFMKVYDSTKHSIYILTVDKGSQDYHRYELIKFFPPKKKGGFIKNADWFRDLFSSLNIKYSETPFSYSSKEKIKVEDAIEYFVTYFQALGYTLEEVKDKIIEYIYSNSKEGYLEETHTLNKILFCINKV